MKKSIIFSLIVVLSAFLATSVSSAFAPEKIDFPLVKSEKSILNADVLADVNAVEIVNLQSPLNSCELILSHDISKDTKLKNGSYKNKDCAIPSEGIVLKHPKHIYFTRYSRYEDKLSCFNRQVFCYKNLSYNFSHSPNFSKV